MRILLRLALPVASIVLALACGGANPNEKQAGAQEGGTALAAGDIAVSNSGAYVAFAYGQQLAVGWVGTGELDTLDVAEPTRLAFQHIGQATFVASEADQLVHAIDPVTGTELWQGVVTLVDDAFRIDVSADDAYVVTHGAAHVEVLDGVTGALVWRHDTVGELVDVDIVGTRVVLVQREEWVDDAPLTRVEVLSLAAGTGSSFEVPNCASALEVLPKAGIAFIAPTSCTTPSTGEANDPISVLDLTPGDEGFARNLPGFGPVAVAPDGWTVVGFYARSSGDASLFDDPAQIPGEDTAEYHVLILDGANLTFELVEYGDELPRYTVSPDGQLLLTDTFSLERSVELLDLTTRTWRLVQGPPLYLDNYALSSDGAAAYVLQGRDTPGLFHLDLVSAVSAEVDAGFLPTNLNLSPTDDTLFLRESGTRICVFDLAEEACAQWFDTAELYTDGPSWSPGS